MPADTLTVTTQFAMALDTEDYATARTLLSNDCLYEIGAQTLIGIDAIVASYQKDSNEAPKRFDAIEYASAVESTGTNTAVIKFTDRVRLADEWHDYYCMQHVTTNHDGLIGSIRHEEIPGQRETLNAFEKRQRAGGTSETH